MFNYISLQKCLSVIETHFSLSLSITKLEYRGISLFDAISEINKVQEYVDVIPQSLPQSMGEVKQNGITF